MTATPITREITVQAGTTSVRPRLPCCPHRQVAIGVAGTSLQQQTAVVCPLCGQNWLVTRVAGDPTHTFTWEPGLKEAVAAFDR